MNIIKKSSSHGFIAGMLLSLFTGHAAAALDISQSPLALADQVASNVMVMLDNSGSMTIKMYKSDYVNTKEYTGIFDHLKKYTYDDTIPVNTGAYPTIVDASGATMIDADAKGAFVESANCSLEGTNNCWSGNFLNWLTARRIDASRKVLIGGKLESRSSHPYGGDLKYKIVANNEPSDNDETDSYSSSSTYSPIPNGQTVTISSPAADGKIKSKYDPYAKLYTYKNTPILNQAGTAIGEFNTVSIDESYTTITLNSSYTDPIVVATAPSYSDDVPVAVRIKSVTSTSFNIKLKRWKYDLAANPDTTHGSESISFIVIEKGEHVLPGDIDVKAGTTDTSNEYVANNCGTARTNNTPVSFASAFDAVTPVVISASMTENGGDPINTRVWDISSSGFKLALQEEEGQNGHTTETVGYIAIEPGTVNDDTTKFKLLAGTQLNVDNTTDTITYTADLFTSTPAFIAAMQTLNEGNTAALRLNSNSASTATLHVEEEQSCDNEVTHANENVGYVALEGAKTSFNLALAVPETESGTAPQGILHEVKDDVRLGVSFYRFDPNKSDNNGIYRGVRTDGGTLRFKIPNNPYVKVPSDTANLPTAQENYRELDGYIGTPIADIVDAIEHYPMIWGTTPIAENLWEVIQYYEQDTPHYAVVDAGEPGFKDFDLATDANPERDPFYVPQYKKRLHCVNSNVLIVTDGEPFRDANVPADQVDYDSDSHAKDMNTAANNNQEDNLDDIAYWAFCDRGADKSKTCIDNATGKATVHVPGSDPQTERTNLRDLRPDATNPDMPGNQYLKIDTIAFAGDSISQVLQDTADNAGGTAYKASDGSELQKALREAFDTASKNTSASAVSANSTRLSGDTLIFQASFNSGDWGGKLAAFALDKAGEPVSKPTWHTDSPGTFKAHADRAVYSYKPGTGGIAFKAYADLSASQQTSLGATEAEATARINYIRGDTSTNEGDAGLKFRARTVIAKDPVTGNATTHKRILGDIANSNPWYVGRDNFGYSLLPSTEGSSYRAHLTSTSTRKDTVYVGSNNGMLHAFDAATGKEKFAYVPATTIPKLSKLTDAGYGNNPSHEYFVDGSPRAGDVYFGGSWHTVLVGTTGAGGRGLFALDVTDPDQFSASKVLFEINNSNDGDLGASIPEPSIVRMANGKWALVTGNGYNSDSGKAMLLIIDIQTGAIIKKIDTGVGGTSAGQENGLGTPIAVDSDADRIVDTIYAGDLKGNLWKFDVSDKANTGKWQSAFIDNQSIAKPMFAATDQATSNPQPITAKPQVGRHPDDGLMVYFGTGKFFEAGDNVVGASPQVQTFYGLRDNFDNGKASPISGLSDLQQQSIIYQASNTFDIDDDGDGQTDRTVSHNVRVTTDNAVDYSSNNPKLGWYMHLQPPSGSGKGERVISQPVLNGNRILFATMAPDEDPCSFGGSGWLMLVDGPTGKRVTTSTFDFTGDGRFEADDYVTVTIDGEEVTVLASGKETGGPGKLGGGLSDGSKVSIHINKTNDDGEVETETTNMEDLSGTGRQSWRQLK